MTKSKVCIGLWKGQLVYTDPVAAEIIEYLKEKWLQAERNAEHEARA